MPPTETHPQWEGDAPFPHPTLPTLSASRFRRFWRRTFGASNMCVLGISQYFRRCFFPSNCRSSNTCAVSNPKTLQTRYNVNDWKLLDAVRHNLVTASNRATPLHVAGGPHVAVYSSTLTVRDHLVELVHRRRQQTSVTLVNRRLSSCTTRPAYDF